ncbi:hypothetical protein [Methylococcus sp. EFPC2]|uniref:hypothetical protein n=1 Tax=Methylococcus sp. EFPC2 TaxID=2812648 RepID=UPI001966DBDB|nr:hypothetical protein [Methylococcus sp. EFPC2]QSA98167.1 hypothetical protein JWZ97_04935 [Methylococcus sp. EFPC2]
MKTCHHRLVAFALLVLAPVFPVLASNSVAAIDVEGNATCSSLSVNSVLQAKDTSYVPDASGYDHVTGPDGQIFTYKLDPNDAKKIAVWSVSGPDPSLGTAKPVNFVIAKEAGSAGGHAFYFSNPGVYSDTNETDDTAPANIVAVSFCYGLSGPFVPTPPTALPTCDVRLCDQDPASVQARIVTKFDEPADNTQNWQVTTCSCEGASFTACDPNLRTGTEVPPGTPAACTKGNLQFLPVEVQLGRDPDSYYCTVINGTRRCFSR